jgi:hypothetical protein
VVPLCSNRAATVQRLLQHLSSICFHELQHAIATLLLRTSIHSPISSDKVTSAGPDERCPAARHGSDLCRTLDMDFRELLI